MKASHLSAFFLGVIAWGAWNAQIPETPAWVNDGCAGVVCTMPTETFDGFTVGQSWYERGTPELCPDQFAGQRGCVGGDPDFRAWIALMRGDLSQLILVADSTLYGPPGALPLNVGVPGDEVWPAWVNGGAFAYGLPPVSLQLPAIPALDSQAYSDWWDDKCAASPTCSMNHSHQFTLTMPDGSTFTGTTGLPQ